MVMRFKRRSEKTLWSALLFHPTALFCLVFAYEYIREGLRAGTESGPRDQWDISIGLIISGIITAWATSGYAVGVWACWDRVHLIPTRQLIGAGVLITSMIVASICGVYWMKGTVFELWHALATLFFPLGTAVMTYGTLKPIGEWYARKALHP